MAPKPIAKSKHFKQDTSLLKIDTCGFSDPKLGKFRHSKLLLTLSHNSEFVFHKQLTTKIKLK